MSDQEEEKRRERSSKEGEKTEEKRMTEFSRVDDLIILRVLDHEPNLIAFVYELIRGDDDEVGSILSLQVSISSDDDVGMMMMMVRMMRMGMMVVREGVRIIDCDMVEGVFDAKFAIRRGRDIRRGLRDIPAVSASDPCGPIARPSEPLNRRIH
jgi:hypothetical protein